MKPKHTHVHREVILATLWCCYVSAQPGRAVEDDEVFTVDQAARLRESSPKLTNKSRSHASLVTVLLTISIVLCWGPNLVYFTIIGMANQPVDMIINVVTTNMFIVQSIFDPILFIIVQEDVRRLLATRLRSLICV